MKSFTALITLLISVPVMHAGEMSAELDTANNRPLLDTHFTHYGRRPARYSAGDGNGLRLGLSSSRIEGQFGVYSLFGLTGDFEISTTYHVLSMTAPNSGYGVSFGIVVDDQQVAGIVSVARGRRPREQDGYLVTRGTGPESDRTYDSTQHPSPAKAGRMVLRREKREIVCLVADDLKQEPHEVSRLTYTDGPVRQVRLFADSGGVPATLDAILTGLRIRAEGISGDLPRQPEGHALAWWLAAIALAMTAALVVVVRRRRNKDD